MENILLSAFDKAPFSQIKNSDYEPAFNEAIKQAKAEIQEIIGADSLEFLDLTDFIKSTGLPKTRLNLSSFNGEYPIEVPRVNSF